jgi:L-amino acid N-acyltransferase YncA
MVIRPSRREDADAIEGLFHEFVSYLSSIGDTVHYRFSAAQYLADGFGESPAFRGLVAEDETGTVVGYVLFSPTYDGEYLRGLFVIDLYVREASRGRGIGRALMERVHQLAKQEGLSRVSWNVHGKNAAALEFYRSMGGEVAEDVVVMYVDL